MQNFLFCIVNGFLYVCQVMNDQLLGKGGVVFVYLNLRVDRSKLVRISSHRLNLVDDLRNYIIQRCAFMNTGFVPCYPALSGPYNVTVEIIGTGEVEMSNGNFINQNNSGLTRSIKIIEV